MKCTFFILLVSFEWFWVSPSLALSSWKDLKPRHCSRPALHTGQLPRSACFYHAHPWHEHTSAATRWATTQMGPLAASVSPSYFPVRLLTHKNISFNLFFFLSHRYCCWRHWAQVWFQWSGQWLPKTGKRANSSREHAHEICQGDEKFWTGGANHMKWRQSTAVPWSWSQISLLHCLLEIILHSGPGSGFPICAGLS